LGVRLLSQSPRSNACVTLPPLDWIWHAELVELIARQGAASLDFTEPHTER